MVIVPVHSVAAPLMHQVVEVKDIEDVERIRAQMAGMIDADAVIRLSLEGGGRIPRNMKPLLEEIHVERRGECGQIKVIIGAMDYIIPCSLPDHFIDQMITAIHDVTGRQHAELLRNAARAAVQGRTGFPMTYSNNIGRIVFIPPKGPTNGESNQTHFD